LAEIALIKSSFNFSMLIGCLKLGFMEKSEEIKRKQVIPKATFQ